MLERNPDYFGDAPKIDRVRFRVVPEAIVRALELRKGTADIGGVNSLTPDMVLALTKQPDLIAEDQPGTVLAYVAFNFDDPILAHREVRQALAYATDRAALIRYLLRGQARPASSLLPPNHWAYEPNVQQYDYDPAPRGDAAGCGRISTRRGRHSNSSDAENFDGGIREAAGRGAGGRVEQSRRGARAEAA